MLGTTGIRFYGRRGAAALRNGVNARLTSAWGSRYCFRFTGAGITANVEMSDGTWNKVRIDGGAWTTLTATGAGTWDTAKSLASGLSDTTHELEFVHNQTGTYVAVANAFTITGASPAISAPTLDGTYLKVGESPLSGTLVQHARWAAAPNEGHSSPSALTYTNFADGIIRFKRRCSGMRLYGRSGTVWTLLANGMAVSQQTVPINNADSVWAFTPVWSGLDDTQEVEYTLTTSRQVAGFIDAIEFFGDHGTPVSSPSSAPTRYIFGRGDSLTQSQYPNSSTTYDTTNGWMFRLWKDHGVGPYNGGRGNYKSANVVSNNSEVATLTSPVPKAIVTMIGTNDLRTGSPPKATWLSNVDSISDANLAGTPSTTKNIITSIPPYGDMTGEANRLDWNTDLAVQVNGIADGRTFFRNLDHVFTDRANDMDATDKVHFTLLGNAKMTNFAAPYGYATGYSVNLSVPTVAAGSPVTITLTRAGGTYWVADEVITLSDGGAGGTFDDSTPTLTAGQTSAQTTYTPASAGTVNIASTNNVGWDDPSAQSLTVISGDDESSSSSSASSASSASSNSSSSSTESSGSSGSSMSSSSSSSEEFSESSSSSSQSVEVIETPTLISGRSVAVYDYGINTAVQGKDFIVAVDGLDPDATVKLYANGQQVAAGEITGASEVKFTGFSLPLGRYHVSLVQERDGVESEVSNSLLVRVNNDENVASLLSPPSISPSDVVSFDFPVTVTLTSSVPGASIYYVVDGTGWAQPTELYTGPFEVSQTAVVKARTVYRGLKSRVTKTTIRIVR
jgi:hypothetical protein